MLTRPLPNPIPTLGHILVTEIFGLVTWNRQFVIKCQSWIICIMEEKILTADKLFRNGGLRSVWPDLAKFSHFVKTLKLFDYSLMVYFVLGKILNLIGQIFMILDRFSLLLMAQYWKDNLAIWSHWIRYFRSVRVYCGLCVQCDQKKLPNVLKVAQKWFH